MWRSRALSRDEEVELESLLLQDLEDDDDLISSPDAPLAMAPTSTQTTTAIRRPKWLSHAARHRDWYHRWVQPISSYLIHLFRPRLTWRYVLFSALALYVLYCFVRGSPLFASPLPPHMGVYGVGAVDLEIPLQGGPKRISEAVFKHSGDPAFDVETLLVTLYYPTDPAFRSRKSRHYWIPKPISLTSKGYAKVAHLDNFVTRPLLTSLLWAVAGHITIPAEVDAPILGSPSLDSDSDGESQPGPFPIMVFSHGSASSRTDYTYFLGELASHGHVVAAIEHRDGSCPGTLIKLTPDDPGRPRLHMRPSDLKDKMDTPEFKRTQLAFRDAEIRAAIDLLTSLNQGTQPDNNTRAPVTTLDNWAGRLNTALLTIAGHSYGATGALQALSTVAPNASAGIILDPGKSSGPLNHNATVPLLVIHSNSWSRTHSIFHGRPHFDTVRDLVRGAAAPSWFLTSIGTSHPSVTDAPLLEPLLLRWTTGAGMDVKAALREYVGAANDFMTYVATGEVPGGLLSEKVTHEKYGEWISEDRKREFPKGLAKHWEIHVTPDS
ncbi:hypothetical protein ACO1O0_002591 [Amphichorda felina]